jgi:hypothetical protein
VGIPVFGTEGLVRRVGTDGYQIPEYIGVSFATESLVQFQPFTIEYSKFN